jgi:hypothetical protein
MSVESAFTYNRWRGNAPAVEVHTDDGLTFTIRKDGIEMQLTREETETLVDEAGIHLLVTRELVVEPIEDTP